MVRMVASCGQCKTEFVIGVLVTGLFVNPNIQQLLCLIMANLAL